MSVGSGHFYRDASGRLTYGREDLPAERYEEICAAVAARFALSPSTERVAFLSTAFQSFASSDGKSTVGLEWDNWFGFTVVANTPESENLVSEIAEFVADV